uniref:C2H2-type domain-containing protein n=1 Tax=Ciona intestinalis TaxID=7719 RepID=H2XZP7_CIOIN
MLEDVGITKKIIKTLRKCVKIFTQNPEILKCRELNFLHDWIVQYVVETDFDSQALSGVQTKIWPNDMQVTVEVTSSDDLCETQNSTTNQIPPKVWETSSFDRICDLSSSQTNTEKHLDRRKEDLVKRHNENDMLAGKTCDCKNDADLEEPKAKLARLSVEKCGNKSSKKMNLAKPFQCRICLKDFKSISGLDIHVNQHTEQHKFECSYCGKQYLNTSGLKYHLKICTKTRKRENLLADNKQAYQNLLIDSVKLTRKHFLKC